MICVVHATVPMQILVDDLTGKVTEVVIAKEHFAYDDPVFVTDLDGQPVSEERRKKAYDAASEQEDEWNPRTPEESL